MRGRTRDGQPADGDRDDAERRAHDGGADTRPRGAAPERAAGRVGDQAAPVAFVADHGFRLAKVLPESAQTRRTERRYEAMRPVSCRSWAACPTRPGAGCWFAARAPARRARRP